MFNVDIQDGHKKWQENDFCKTTLVDFADSLWIKNFVVITLSHSVFKINGIFNTEIHDGCEKWQENDFWEKSEVDSPATLWVTNFVEITLSRSVSEINAFLCLTQKFKMATKSGEKIFFEKISPVESPASLWVKNLVKIALCGSVSEISRFLCLTQKFKMAAKIGRKTIFVATRLCRYPVFQIFRRFVSEINTFLHLTQKFKMAAKEAGK